MDKHGFLPADILLPKADFEKWAVIACDQFTSEKSYWDEVEEIVGDAPSALRVTLPEIYLEDDKEGRIECINKTMQVYVEQGILAEYKNSMIYVERTQSDGTVRHGVVGKIKLSDYNYEKGSKALIRATEQTVVERIPPRVQIRKDAPIELPHVLLLIDDPQKTVIEPLSQKTENLKSAYDFELMQGGGHIKGWFVDEQNIESIGLAVDMLVANDEDKLMFAVGDGNHSLATAKECSLNSEYSEDKYALVEIVNIHDDSIVFEPIYRVLFGLDPMKVIADMKAHFGEYNGSDAHKFTLVFKDSEVTISVKPTSKLPVGTLQAWLDEYIRQNNAKIDYIHGTDSVKTLCSDDNAIGFIFDGMRKDELFAAVRADGFLPRKTFSMGHARDKRYYIEARRIK